MSQFEFQEKTNYSPKIPLKKKIFETRSKYQKIEVFETELFGNMLVLDGSIQTTEKDEFIYHEMITYPAIAIADSVKNVLIVGGGDGGVAKEILRYDPGIDVEIVEIDEAVIDTSRRFLPGVSSVTEGDKVKITIGDGVEFLQKMRDKKEKKDLIIVDSTDPTAFAQPLFSESFYENAKACSRIFVAQTESPISSPKEHKSAIENMKRVFPWVYTYFAYIPTYPSCLWSFSLGMHERLKKVKKLNTKTRYYSRSLFLCSMKSKFG